jgi:hypothetical protein
MIEWAVTSTLSENVWPNIGVSAMKRDARYLGATVLFLGLVLGGPPAEADLISASNSTFALTAQSYLGSPPGTIVMDAQSQGSTLNTPSPLSATVSAQSTDANSSLLVSGSGLATWTSASTGVVTFTNFGWNAVNVANGGADLSLKNLQNVGWVYTFVSNVTGSFNINYNVTAHGTSTNVNPLAGLTNGFFLYEVAGSTPPGSNPSSQPTLMTGLNTGSAALAITPGNTYTVEIQSSANLFSDIATTDASMSGTFDFDVVPAPEPSSLTVSIAASCLAGFVVCLKRRRQAAGKS